jgi:hypothetical protein
VSPANPIGNTHTVNSDGSVVEGSKSLMSGYTIVETNTIEDAISFAIDCPFLDVGGSIEVSELIPMPG